MKRRQRGFTLIELLVAVAIFAVIAALAYGGLQSVVNQREDTDAQMQRLRQVQLAFTILARDFSQLEPRPIRDPLGGASLPAFSGGPQNLPLVEFTRGGWMNPLAEVRSTEERVAYELDKDDLVRISWPELDRTAQTQPLKQTLLTKVTAFKVEYLDANNVYQAQWPPLNTTQSQYLNKVPPVVKITVTLKDWGTIDRLFEVATPPLNATTSQ